MNCLINENVPWMIWRTILFQKHEGEIVKIDSGTVVVNCTDGKQRCIRIDPWFPFSWEIFL